MFFNRDRNGNSPDKENKSSGLVASTDEQSGMAGQATAVFDVDMQGFENQVLKTSMKTPVLVDFWAPWCGPCKQLTPALEKAVQEAGGKILLAKVNLDENQELAQAMRIQSVPTVYAFFGGQPVDGFQGSLPESQIREFIKKIISMARQSQPDALDIPQALSDAAQALADQNLQGAQAIYSRILSEEPENTQAYIGLVRTFIAAGNIEQAKQIIDQAPAPVSDDPNFAEARTALEFAENSPDGNTEELKQKLDANPDDHQIRFDLALAEFAAGQKREAVDHLLTIIAKDREWNEEAARTQLLKFFEAMGHADPLTIESRKRLSAMLFS